MDSKNMNYAFSVEYMENVLRGKKKDVKEYNSELLDVVNCNIGDILDFNCKKIKYLRDEKRANIMYFTTQYPGMLVGTGLPHETKGVSGGIQVGFSFDFVTGTPYYPGSSLKGILRSVFDKASERDNNNEYLEFINSITDNKYTSQEMQNLTEKIFGQTNSSRKVQMGVDIFYDSYPVDVYDKLIGTDNITPHTSPLKSPIPLTMLRIMPNVIFAMPVKIVDNIEINNIKVTVEDRKEIYRAIVETFGIGAKTNVGYGILEATEEAGILDKKHSNLMQPKYEADALDATIKKIIESTYRDKKTQKTCKCIDIYLEGKEIKQNASFRLYKESTCLKCGDRVKVQFKEERYFNNKVANFYNYKGTEN